MPTSRKTGQESMYWALDFQSIKLPTAPHCLSLNILLSMFLQNKSSGRIPTLWFIQGLDLVKMWNSGCRDPGGQQPPTPSPTLGHEQLPVPA